MSGGLLVGVCQRDGNFYHHLTQPDDQFKIKDAIEEFWEEEILPKLPAADSFVFDVYMEDSTDKVSDAR